jgi:hypothetical protein
MSSDNTAVLEAPAVLTNERALEILTDAADFISDFMKIARKALEKVDPALVAKALTEEPAEWPLDASPQKRPRGRMHPVLSLFKMAIAASRVLTRIVAWTNPALAPNGGGNLDASVQSAMSMVAGLEKLSASLNLPSG